MKDGRQNAILKKLFPTLVLVDLVFIRKSVHYKDAPESLIFQHCI